jgi:hypothetical protein
MNLSSVLILWAKYSINLKFTLLEITFYCSPQSSFIRFYSLQISCVTNTKKSSIHGSSGYICVQRQQLQEELFQPLLYQRGMEQFWPINTM